ncbi:MAG: transcription termination/antitermination protein NusA [Blastocatellia bacterium]
MRATDINFHMTSLIQQSIEALCNEQGLDREMVVEAMKDAVKAAARKHFRSQDKTGDSIQVDWTPEDGLEISMQKTVVETVENPATEILLEDAREMAGDDVEPGDILQIPLPSEEMGRIAAQTAKQILVQKVREAIREKVYEEYIDRKGELINGTVKRFERGDIIIDLGNNLEAILPKKEQSRGEVWNQGERIRVVIVDVTKEPKGQQIKVSRASAELVKRLFEMEVPEIYDETVVIKSAVREPGERAKIAVASNEKDVDPVGACVGMKGSRVQAIIKELRGEKIDIIEWSDEPSVFAANALSPAKVSQVRITDIEKRKMHVIVSEDQLSLAIGKRGQNVRLATRLVGWDIDIISEEVLKREIALQMGRMMASGEAVPVTALEGVTPNQADILAAKGVDDVEKLAAMSIDDLVDALDLTFDEASAILSSAKAVVAAKEAGVTDGQLADSGKVAQMDKDQDVATDVGQSQPEENEIETVEAVETSELESGTDGLAESAMADNSEDAKTNSGKTAPADAKEVPGDPNKAAAEIGKTVEPDASKRNEGDEVNSAPELSSTSQ